MLPAKETRPDVCECCGVRLSPPEAAWRRKAAHRHRCPQCDAAMATVSLVDILLATAFAAAIVMMVTAASFGPADLAIRTTGAFRTSGASAAPPATPGW